MTKIDEIPLESHCNKLSYAFYLLVNDSDELPIGDLDVSLKETSIKPIKNHDSYYLFLNVPDGDYTLQVRAEYYCFLKIPIKVGGKVSKLPPVPTFLIPKSPEME
jgi:hypothetical protein